jgi:hypothetical protein
VTTVKGAITLVPTGLLLASLVPGPGRAAAIVTGAATAPLTHAQQTLLAVAPADAAALLTINLALGVAKPRLRRRPARNYGGTGDESAAPAPSRRLNAHT